MYIKYDAVDCPTLLDRPGIEKVLPGDVIARARCLSICLSVCLSVRPSVRLCPCVRVRCIWYRN